MLPSWLIVGGIDHDLPVLVVVPEYRDSPSPDVWRADAADSLSTWHR